MKIHKTIALVMTLALLLLLPGCGGTRYKNGTYYAEMPEFAESGWKDTLELTIENGEIVQINWDAVYVDDSIPIRKKQYSKSGLYGMLMTGAVGEWFDQAVAAEQYVLDNGINALGLTPDGYTDAVAGCTIHVSTFDYLVRECLEQAKK